MTYGVHGKEGEQSKAMELKMKTFKSRVQQEEESSGKKARIQISGAARNSQIIQQASATVDVDRNLSKNKETKKVIQQSNPFHRKRRGIKLEKLNDNKGTQRREHTILKNSVIAVMPILMGKVSINKCTSNKWIPKIWDELTLWNVQIDKAEGLQKLKEKLLVHG
jgi:hypothetical protein